MQSARFCTKGSNVEKDDQTVAIKNGAQSIITALKVLSPCSKRQSRRATYRPRALRMPYAEGQRDKADLSLSGRDARLIATLRQHSKKLIVILLSGRPMIIGPHLNESECLEIF